MICKVKGTKSRIPLEENIAYLFRQYGQDRVLFVTFTTPDRVYDKVELQRRWNSLTTHVLRKFIVAGVAIPEQHKDGAWHIHAVIVLPWSFKIHGEFWSEVKRKYYANCDPQLRWFWNTLRKVGIGYGFGRFEALPSKKGGTAMSRYLSKYLSKALANRHGKTKLKGMRLVRYINAQSKLGTKRTLIVPGSGVKIRIARKLVECGAVGVDITRWKVATTRFSSVKGGLPFRLGCAILGVRKMELVMSAFGSKWGYRLSKLIYEAQVKPVDLWQMLQSVHGADLAWGIKDLHGVLLSADCRPPNPMLQYS